MECGEPTSAGKEVMLGEPSGRVSLREVEERKLDCLSCDDMELFSILLLEQPAIKFLQTC